VHRIRHLLARVEIRQAEFSRLTGITAHQVNTRCRSRAAPAK
jgi:hypothetical protein